MVSGYPATFPTRDEALDAIVGWLEEGHRIAPQQWYLPNDPNADEGGNAWVVVSDGDKHPHILREDGSLR